MNLTVKTKALNIIRSVFLNPAMESFLLKQTKKGKRLNFFNKIIPPNYLYPIPTYRECERRGIHYKLDLSSFTNWAIFWNIEDELLEKKKLYSIIKNGNVVVDIGAHIGEISMEMSKIVGTSGKVISFEPHPITFKQMQHNLSLNNFNNIVVNNIGLGDTKGEFGIKTVDAHNPGMNTISTISDGNFIVKVDTLDNYFDDNSINKIDTIKIDVEGFELNILKGAVKTIEKWHPNIFMELSDSTLKSQGSSPKEIVEFVEKKGYSKIVNASNDKLVSSSDDFSNVHFDIVCFFN